MSREAEKTLFGLLIDLNEITTLAMEGLVVEAIPTLELQPIYEWAIRYFHQSGRTMPPSIEAFKDTPMTGKDTRSMYDVLTEYDIVLGELPDQHMLWAIEELKATYLKKEVQDWSLETGRKLVEVPSGETASTLAERASNLVSLSMSVESHQTRIELTETASDIITDYEARRASAGVFQGMHFGLPAIDAHTNGIHDGELAVLAAYAKVGKSFFLDHAALREWEAGRSVALFTLENSLIMTRDRIACLATGIDPIRFEMGESTDQEFARVMNWVEQNVTSATSRLHILRPDPGEATAQQMVLKARLLGAQSLMVDQLTFVEPSNPKIKRDQQIRDIMHEFKGLISSSNNKMPCLLAHQMNREGIKLARKNGYHMLTDFAEGAEVERTVDWGFSLFQGPDLLGVKQLLCQILVVRRRPIKNWLLNWDISRGDISVHEEYGLPE